LSRENLGDSSVSSGIVPANRHLHLGDLEDCAVTSPSWKFILRIKGALIVGGFVLLVAGK
jgi:hypothetical protein